MPQTAIEYNLYGNIVYVIKHEDGKTFAMQTFVSLGQRRGDVVVVEKGLQPGVTPFCSVLVTPSF